MAAAITTLKYRTVRRGRHRAAMQARDARGRWRTVATTNARDEAAVKAWARSSKRSADDDHDDPRSLVADEIYTLRYLLPILPAPTFAVTDRVQKALASAGDLLPRRVFAEIDARAQELRAAATTLVAATEKAYQWLEEQGIEHSEDLDGLGKGA
jgi:hypothetical protein